MEPQDLSPKLSKLSCELILQYIDEKYKPIEKKYGQIDELFDISETEERNSGIITSYLTLYKKVEEFRNIVSHAINRVRLCDYNIKPQIFYSACSKNICQKHLNKIVDTEWTKDIGTLTLYSQDLTNIRDNIINYHQRVNDLLQRLKTGIGCMKDSLKKEEKTLENYVWDVDKKQQELEYLADKKNGLSADLLQAETELLKTSLKNTACDIDSKRYRLDLLEVWLNFRLHTKLPGQDDQEREKIKQELNKKLANTQRMKTKYLILKKEITDMINTPLLKEKPYVVFKN